MPEAIPPVGPSPDVSFRQPLAIADPEWVQDVGDDELADALRAPATSSVAIGQCAMHDQSPPDPSCSTQRQLPQPDSVNRGMQPMHADDNSLASFVDVISTRAQPLLPAPKPRRKRKEVPANFTPRRSFMIAKADISLSSEMKAKRVLLRRLGIIADDNSPISNEMLGKYAQLFERPLALDVVEAFADFFRWQLPATLPTTSSEHPHPLLIEAQGLLSSVQRSPHLLHGV